MKTLVYIIKAKLFEDIIKLKLNDTILGLDLTEFKSSFQPKSPEYKLEPKFNVPTLI